MFGKDTSMGRIDLFHSRRTNYHKCRYWIRDERNKTGNPSQWILMNQPSGSFYAKSISVKSTQMDVINGVWSNNKNRITLETDDDVDNLERGCIVEYNNELWLVEANQRQEHVKESEFAKHIDYKHIISLTKG